MQIHSLGKRGVGIPVILLHDAEGGIITIEMKNGDSYRGFLDEAQDNMNCTLKVSDIISIVEYLYISFNKKND